MEPINIMTAVALLLGTPLLALIGYMHMKISKLEDKMNECVSEAKVNTLLDDNLEFMKEKVADKFDPIAERLIRLEDKIDQLMQRRE